MTKKTQDAFDAWVEEYRPNPKRVANVLNCLRCLGRNDAEIQLSIERLARVLKSSGVIEKGSRPMSGRRVIRKYLAEDDEGFSSAVKLLEQLSLREHE